MSNEPMVYTVTTFIDWEVNVRAFNNVQAAQEYARELYVLMIKGMDEDQDVSGTIDELAAIADGI